MSLDELFLITFFAGFIRCTAMLLASPLTGNSIPVSVRVMLGAVISLSLTPVISPFIGAVPTNILELGALAFKEAAVGLSIGMVLQFLSATFLMAGSLLDLQIGIGSAQIMNPTIGQSATPLGQFKFWLSIVLLFLLNAHQMMFHALVASYKLPGFLTPSSDPVTPLLQLLGNLVMISVQVAAPVMAVTIIIDIAASLINKAVPQTQPFLISTPAKLALGIVTLSLALPAIVVTVQRAVELTFTGMVRILGG